MFTRCFTRGEEGVTLPSRGDPSDYLIQHRVESKGTGFIYNPTIAEKKVTKAKYGTSRA